MGGTSEGLKGSARLVIVINLCGIVLSPVHKFEVRTGHLDRKEFISVADCGLGL